MCVSLTRRPQRDLTPATWQRYFSSSEDVRLEGGDVFHVYRAGSSGPLLVLLHGGGFSGLTWALFTVSGPQSLSVGCWMGSCCLQESCSDAESGMPLREWMVVSFQ